MQFSIELLPAPFGPMIARISCSRTSKLMSVSALTPPKRRLMLRTSRTTSPMRRARPARVGPRRRLAIARAAPAAASDAAAPSCRPPRHRERLRVDDLQVGRDLAGAAVLERHLGLDVLSSSPRVERVDERG